MPIKPENRKLYPADWKQISADAKARAAGICQHQGCTAHQYDIGWWLRSSDGAWLWSAVSSGISYSHARQRAAEEQFSRGEDGPKLIVIVLTVAHLNHDPADCRPENLAAMCQRHHLAYDQHHHNETAYATRMAKRGNMELPLA